MTDVGIFTASVWESRCCHRRLCMDWQKVSLWNLFAIHLQPNCDHVGSFPSFRHDSEDSVKTSD